MLGGGSERGQEESLSGRDYRLYDGDKVTSRNSMKADD